MSSKFISNVSTHSIEKIANLLRRSLVILDLKYDLTFFNAENDLSNEQLDVCKYIVNAIFT